MTLWVGDATGTRRQVADPWIGDGTGTRRQVQKAWVGDAEGVPRLVFTRSAPVDLTAVPASTSRIDLSWTDAGAGLSYVLKRGSTTIYTGTGLSKADTGLAADTAYTYLLEARSGSTVLSSDTATARTLVPTTQQKTVTLSPASAGSYYGNNTRRSTAGPYYSGNYTPGSNGKQKSSFHFAVPADVRNCVSVDKVEFSVRNSHTYSGSVAQSIAVTHTQTAGASWPGGTGAFGARTTAKGGWWGNAQWQNITSLVDPTLRTTVADNFRVRNAWGIQLVAPSDDLALYSYWASGTAQLRITYTVRTN